MPKSKTGMRQTTLRASAAGVWQNCAGSITIEDRGNFMDSRSEASFGDLVHKCGEVILTSTGISMSEPNAFFEYIAKHDDFTHDECLRIHQNIEEVWSMVKSYVSAIEAAKYTLELQGYKVQMIVEKRLRFDMAKYTLAGTPDCILVATGKQLVPVVQVFDLKTGYIEVEASESAQLKVYLSLVLNSIGKRVSGAQLIATIVQPSLGVVDNAFYESVLTPQEILEDARAAMSKTDVNDNQFKTGKQCTYCNLNDICPTFAKRLQRYLKPKWHDQTLYRPAIWAELLQVAKPMIKMLEQAQSSALAALKLGVAIPGWELGQRSANRSWVKGQTPATLMKLLKLTKADVFKTSLLNPKGIEEHLKAQEKELMAPFKKRKRLTPVQEKAKAKAQKTIDKQWQAFADLVYSANYQILKRSVE